MSELPLDRLYCGDAVKLTRKLLPDSSVHAIVTDPPYGLEFMGEEWDKFRPSSGILEQYSQTFRSEGKFAKAGLKDAVRIRPSYGMSSGPRPGGKPIGTWWGLGGAIAYQSWTTSWAREALRILKPGASMLVMGGTRTYHRMVCGVEDAGFEIKDTILHCYNSGFPKAQDLGKMIDKRLGRGDERKVISYKKRNPRDKVAYPQKGPLGYHGSTPQGLNPETTPATPLACEWNGWKVGGLKPSYEPIVWAVKSPEGSYIDNVLKYGVGAINVDGCRIPYEGEDDREQMRRGVVYDGDDQPSTMWNVKSGFKTYDSSKYMSEQGRYPANMVRTDRFHDGYDRFYFVPKAGREERWFKCGVCGACQDGTHLRDHDDHALHCHDCGVDFPNTEEGRKSHKKHITESNIIAHPTVKPARLMGHLIKLVTREGQIVADFFCGIGTTFVSARRLNRRYIGGDNNPEYVEISKCRLAAIPKSLEAYAGSGRLTP